MPEPVSTSDPSLFGFAIRTAEPLQFLRAGGGAEGLEVVAVPAPADQPVGEPIGEWPLHGTPYPARAALYQRPNGFEYWTSDAGRFLVDFERGRVEIPAEGDRILREQRLCGMPILLCFAHRGDYSLHAAAVQIGDGAVILAAPSRFGKSTLAFGFHRMGYRVLSEDLVCCRPGSLELLPGPALLRLRPDVYGGSPPPGMRVIAARPDRVYLALEGESRGDCAPLPILGIAFLREADALKVEPARVVDTTRDLWHLGFRLPTSEARAGSFRVLAELAAAVPAWNVSRPLRLECLDETVRLIVREVVGLPPAVATES